MINQILILELGNNKGLRSIKNIIKLLYTYIIPNILVIIAATTISTLTFYDPKQMLKFIVGFNVLITIIIQYVAQRGLFKSLEKEALLKFIPIKVSIFIKIRLFFLVSKFYFPILLFSCVFASYFIRGNYFVFITMFLLLFVSLFYFQIYLAMIIRYCVNTIHQLLLHVLQIGLFLIFITYLFFFYLFFGTFLIEIFENNTNTGEYSTFTIDYLSVFITLIIVVTLFIGFKFVIGQVNINVLIPNRNLNLNINTEKLERLHERIYGLGLSKTQKLLFSKDIKEAFRNNKVLIIVISLLHIVSLGMLVFFFLDIPVNLETGVFMSKFYLVIVIGQVILMGILSVSFKDLLDFENDLKVLENYHIELSKEKLIAEKERILRAFVFPKLNLMYAILIITVLIINQYTLAFFLFINYFQCLLCINTIGLWRIRSINKMNSEHLVLNVVNYVLILLAFNMFIQLLHINYGKFLVYQMMFLGALIVLYCFHLFVFKKKSQEE